MMLPFRLLNNCSEVMVFVSIMIGIDVSYDALSIVPGVSTDKIIVASV